MGGGMGRSLVMYSLGMRSSLVMCSLGMRSLVMCNLGMCGLVVCSLVMYSLGVGSLVMCSLGMCGLVVCSLVMDSLGMCGLVVHSGGVFTDIGLNHGLWMAVIHRVVLVPIISSFLLMRALRCCCLDTTTVCCRLFSGCRSRVDSTGAVKADVIIDSSVVDPCTVNIGVVDDGRIHVPNRCVIPKDVALPPAAVETGSVIAESIVDTSVESNVGTPITVVPTIDAVPKTPVTRGPKVSGLGHLNPGARNPEITVISVSPVARTPKISVLRTRRLLVDDEGRRRNCNRNALSEQRRCCAQ